MLLTTPLHMLYWKSKVLRQKPNRIAFFRLCKQYQHMLMLSPYISRKSHVCRLRNWFHKLNTFLILKKKIVPVYCKYQTDKGKYTNLNILI